MKSMSNGNPGVGVSIPNSGGSNSISGISIRYKFHEICLWCIALLIWMYLSGEVPEELAHHSYLQSLNLFSNQLSGKLSRKESASWTYYTNNFYSKTLWFSNAHYEDEHGTWIYIWVLGNLMVHWYWKGIGGMLFLDLLIIFIKRWFMWLLQ